MKIKRSELKELIDEIIKEEIKYSLDEKNENNEKNAKDFLKKIETKFRSIKFDLYKIQSGNRGFYIKIHYLKGAPVGGYDGTFAYTPINISNYNKKYLGNDLHKVVQFAKKNGYFTYKDFDEFFIDITGK